MTWQPSDIPDQTGRVALVTGVTAGIGEQTALVLARNGAEVILAARNPAKLEKTVATIEQEVPGAKLQRLIVDVSDLSSIRTAAKQAADFGPINLLINNAGVMAVPYQRTADGFEMQLATNHFGPFALTGLLLSQLIESGDGRVVAVSSNAHKIARSAPLGDPRVVRGRYSRWHSYAQSKLADLLFTYELDRRLRAAGHPVKALAAHPGFAATELMSKKGGRSASILQAAFQLAGQPAHMGAWPTLMAATADLPGSTYVGPRNLLQMRGEPRIVASRRLSHDRDAQRQLWELSEEATGVRYL